MWSADTTRIMLLGLGGLAIPFVVGMLAAWAWRWRGIAVCFAAGPVIAVLISLSRSAIKTGGMDLSAITTFTIHLTEIWLFASIPGVIVGFAIYTIKNRPPRSN